MDASHILISISTLIAVSTAVVLAVHFLTRHTREVAERLDDLSGMKHSELLRRRGGDAEPNRARNRSLQNSPARSCRPAKMNGRDCRTD